MTNCYYRGKSIGNKIIFSAKAYNSSMSKLAEPLKIYPQVLEHVRVTDKKVAQDDEAVQAAVKVVAEALGERLGLLLPIFEEKFSFAFGTSTVGIY